MRIIDQRFCSEVTTAVITKIEKKNNLALSHDAIGDLYWIHLSTGYYIELNGENDIRPLMEIWKKTSGRIT